MVGLAHELDTQKKKVLTLRTSSAQPYDSTNLIHKRARASLSKQLLLHLKSYFMMNIFIFIILF